MSRTCSISTMIHHEFHPKRESTIFHHMFTYPSKILRCSTQKSRDGPRTSPDFSAFSRFPSMEAATQLSALLRTTEALARYGAQRRVAVALQCRMRQKWQRKKYLVTWQLGEVMWGYVFIILEDYILNFHSLFMSHTLLDSSLFIFIHLYSSLFIFIHLYSSLFIFIHLYSSMSQASNQFLPLKIQASAPVMSAESSDPAESAAAAATLVAFCAEAPPLRAASAPGANQWRF